MATKRGVWLVQSFSPSGVSVKGLSIEHPCCLLVISRFLSGHSGVLQFAVATEFDNVEAAPRSLHCVRNIKPAIACERAGRRGGGVYNTVQK